MHHLPYTLAERGKSPRKAATEAAGKIQKIYKGRPKTGTTAHDEAAHPEIDNASSAGSSAGTSGYQSAGRQRVAPPNLDIDVRDDDTSGNSGNEDSFRSTAEGSPRRPPPVVMVNFEDQDEVDEKDAHSKMGQVKLDFDQKNVKKWIKRLEIRLEFIGCKSQWLKRVCLENLLPAEIAECCGDLFDKDKSDAGATIYKECK